MKVFLYKFVLIYTPHPHRRHQQSVSHSSPIFAMAESYPSRAPFDDEDADIIFRSSDGVDFRVYKVIVSKLSPMLRDMLAVPPPPDVEGPPIVDVTEDARTLEHIFRLCCPVEHPDISTVEDFFAVLQAARKYEMTAVTANMRLIIKRFLPREPLRIYAIAYMFRMEDVAREAAALLRDDPTFHIPDSPPQELAILPAAAVYAVHMYRKKCVDAVYRVLNDTDWILNEDHGGALPRPTASPNGADPSPPTWVWIILPTDDARVHAPWCTAGDVHLRVLPSGGMYCTRRWWCDYMRALRYELYQRPSGRTIRGYLTEFVHALRDAAMCVGCSPRAHADVAYFNSLLAVKVDEALAEVRIHVKP